MCTESGVTKKKNEECFANDDSWSKPSKVVDDCSRDGQRDMAMKAFVFQDGEAGLQTVPIPVPAAKEALIKVNRAGVCNTDLEILKGYMGFNGVIGHEFVGTVVSVQSDEEEDQVWVNKRVCGDINCACLKASCGTCAQSNTALARNHCPTRSVLGILAKDGTYGEYITLPIRNLHAIPDFIPDEEAVFVEPLAAACRIIEQKVIHPATDRVAVIGDGKLGLLIMEVLMRSGLQHPPCIIGRHPSKMKLLYGDGRLKVDMVILESGTKVNPREDSYIRVESREALQHKFDVVVDATGSPAGLELSTYITRPMGTLVLKSTCAIGTTFNTAPYVIDELRIVGSRCGPFEEAIKLFKNDGAPPLNLKKYISGVYSLDNVEGGIAKAKEKGALKVQITM